MVHSATKEVSVLPAESEGGALFTLITRTIRMLQ